jgi:putative membrane protein
MTDLIAHQWSFEPGVILGLSVMTIGYGLGVQHLWRSAGTGHGISWTAFSSFVSGTLVLILALVSPLDAIADSLQSAHMVQHMLLIVVAPPLLLLGEPLLAFAWMLPRGRRVFLARRWMRLTALRRGAGLLSTPGVALALHATAVVVWHLPVPYDAAVRNESVHALEHLSFLGTALLFWWVVLAPPALRKLPRALDVPYVIAMSLVGGALGAALTFAAAPLYGAYLTTASAWGLTPLEDQQLAGLIMWIPGGFAYLLAAAALFLKWLEGREVRADGAVESEDCGERTKGIDHRGLIEGRRLRASIIED